MDTINEIKRQELPEEQEIDLIELAQKLWKERKFLLKGCGIAVVVGLIVAFSIPKEYTTTVKLAPETQDAAKKAAAAPAGAAAVRARQLRYRGGPDGAGLPDFGRLCPAVCRFPHSVCHPRSPLQHGLPAAACQGGYFASRPHSCARLAGIWQRQFVSEPWFRCHPEGKQRPFLYDADQFRLCLERS